MMEISVHGVSLAFGDGRNPTYYFLITLATAANDREDGKVGLTLENQTVDKEGWPGFGSSNRTPMDLCV